MLSYTFDRFVWTNFQATGLAFIIKNSVYNTIDFILISKRINCLVLSKMHIHSCYFIRPFIFKIGKNMIDNNIFFGYFWFNSIVRNGKIMGIYNMFIG